jgi:CHAD domain-containing protein
MKTVIYQSLKKCTPTGIKKIIGPDFFCSEQKVETISESYYDTFDLTLYKNGSVLYRQNDMLYLFSLADGTDISREHYDGKDVPKFWWDFPENDICTYLKSEIDVRALMLIGTIHEERTRFYIQNTEKKHIARLLLHNRSFYPPALISITPLKGFTMETLQVKKQLREYYQETSNGAVFQTLLAETGYLERLRKIEYPPEIEPHWTVCHTIKTAADHLLKELETYRQGIIDDIDTEFLHSYRVAVRRFRVLIGQLKNELRPESMDSIRAGLQEIGLYTGRLRDLDVLLLNRRYYAELVPEQLRYGLSLFFHYIGEARGKAHAAASAYFTSQDYFGTMDRIEKTCKQPPNKLCLDRNVSIRQKSAEIIKIRFKKLRKKIKRFSKHKEMIHQIRIDCKKARYLLEFFRRLYPGGGIKKTIKELKQFQTSLGNLHDIFVQHEMLMDSIHAMEGSEQSSPEATAAVGGLITALSEKQARYSAEAEAALRHYNAKILFSI